MSKAAIEQEYKKRIIDSAIEVYLKVSMETLMKRDKKGLYSSRVENLVGVTMKMEEPKTPDLVVNNDGSERVEDIVERILSKANEGDVK